MQSSPPSDPMLDGRLRLLVESYQRLTGKPLLPVSSPLPQAGEALGEREDVRSFDISTLSLAFPQQGGGDAGVLRDALWEAPFVIVAHGTEADPVFFYGNRVALQQFEMSFEQFTRLPSRFSAEPLERTERARLLERVTRQGYVDDYSGMRVASSGRRFMISGGTVWNLVDEQGIRHGQAATFSAAL